MIIVGAVAFSTVVSANTMAPAVSIEFSPRSIVADVGAGFVLGCVAGLIFTIIPAVELKLVHNTIEFRFHLAIVLINFDF